MISTEALLTSPEAFGIATATPAQRAACRILDGLPLGELADHPDVLQLAGDRNAVAQLPSERGIMPAEVVFTAAVRSAKTIVSCAAALRMSQTVDLSRLGPGEVPRVSLVSLKLDVAAVPYRILLDTISASPALRPLLLGERSDHGVDVLVLRHPSGREVEIGCVAGSKAGGGLVARWSAGAVFDEAPRMSSASDGAVVNLDDARRAILGRLLPGAQALYIGSPWAPFGTVYDLVQEFHGKPGEHMVVLRGNGPMLNPVWWTPERCERLRKSNPTAYQTDVLGEFADPESGLLEVEAVKRNTREQPAELPFDPFCRYVAALDPSEGSATGNAWTLVIVSTSGAGLGSTYGAGLRMRVALAREWRGARPEQCLEAAAEDCKRYGLMTAHTDQYAASANADLARRFGLHLEIDKTSATSKLEDYTNLQTLVHSDVIELPPDPQVRRDLLSIRKRVTQQGIAIVLPRTGDGRHADFAPALCSAAKHALGRTRIGIPVITTPSSEYQRSLAGTFVDRHGVRRMLGGAPVRADVGPAPNMRPPRGAWR